MKRSILFSFVLLLFIVACENEAPAKKFDTLGEVANAETEFEKMCAEKGIAEGFWFYADSNAVIKRANDTLIKGKEAIRHFYSAEFYKNATVKWSPEQLLEYIVSADLIFYALMVGAVIVLRRKTPNAERPYRTIGYPFVPLIYIFLAVFLVVDLAYLAPDTSGIGYLLVLTGFPVYLIWRRNAGRPDEDGTVKSDSP